MWKKIYNMTHARLKFSRPRSISLEGTQLEILTSALRVPEFFFHFNLNTTLCWSEILLNEKHLPEICLQGKSGLDENETVRAWFLCVCKKGTFDCLPLQLSFKNVISLQLIGNPAIYICYALAEEAKSEVIILRKVVEGRRWMKTTVGGKFTFLQIACKNQKGNLDDFIMRYQSKKKKNSILQLSDWEFKYWLSAGILGFHPFFAFIIMWSHFISKKFNKMKYCPAGSITASDNLLLNTECQSSQFHPPAPLLDVLFQYCVSKKFPTRGKEVVPSAPLNRPFKQINLKNELKSQITKISTVNNNSFPNYQFLPVPQGVEVNQGNEAERRQNVLMVEMNDKFNFQACIVSPISIAFNTAKYSGYIPHKVVYQLKTTFLWNGDGHGKYLEALEKKMKQQKKIIYFLLVYNIRKGELTQPAEPEKIVLRGKNLVFPNSDSQASMFWHSHCAVCTVTVHQSLVESLLDNAWSNNRSFLGLSRFQLQVLKGLSTYYGTIYRSSRNFPLWFFYDLNSNKYCVFTKINIS
ncbi:hypothetical protein VP01_2107g1 [Puccinia sorghi]|uniref:Uncharacterized protein n=1 Tax=Puccinia sorghi TaxID=27349 RepID=A0A0L6VAR3_9BASI|nr:hypothetical protein VP01_2107g1 [Puccinia sorghi]